MSPSPLRHDGAGRHRGGRTDLYLFIVALLVRTLYLRELGSSPLFSTLIGDADVYDAWARRIAAGNWLGAGDGVFYQAPLYPYLLGALYRIAGPGNLLAVRVVQVVLGATACVLLARAARALFPGPDSRRIGAVAGLLLALYPPAIFFDGLIQKSVLDLFFMCLLLCLLAETSQQPLRLWRSGAMGLTLGGLMLTRENALVLVAVVAGWLAIDFRQVPWPHRAKWCGGLALGQAQVLLPVAARNMAVGGEFHLTTSQLGPNFYIGNNPKALGFYVPLRAGRGHAKFERQDATELAEAAVGRKLGPGEVSRFWLGESFRFMRSQPGKWLTLMGRKTLLLLSDAEVSDSEDQYSYADRSRVLRWLGMVWRFGVLIPLAVLGVFLTWPERRRVLVLTLVILAYAASVVLFYVFARYRFPLVPALILLAGAGLVRGGALAARRQYRALAVGGAVALAAALCANAGAIHPGLRLVDHDQMRAVTLVNVGVDLLQRQDRPAEAAAFFDRAIQVYPPYARAYLGLAAVRTRMTDADGALTYYEQAARYGPEMDDVRYSYGLALYQKGQIERAMEQLRAALAINPQYSSAHNLLGLCMAAQQKLPEAIECYGQAVRFDAKNAEAYYNWGNALARQGQVAEAEERFRAAVAANPEYRNARLHLGVALFVEDQLAAAAEQFREVLRRWPGDAEAQQRLAEVESKMR